MLNRNEVMNGGKFGTKSYSLEELTTELGVCFLKPHVGIKELSLENSVSCNQSWLKKHRNDKQCIVNTSVQAQRTVDFILNVKYEQLVREMDSQIRTGRIS